MHDGSLKTLVDLIDFYSDGGRKNPHLDEEIRPAKFTEQEKNDLLAFLKSLTGRVIEGF